MKRMPSEWTTFGSGGVNNLFLLLHAKVWTVTKKCHHAVKSYAVVHSVTRACLIIEYPAHTIEVGHSLN